MWWTMHTNKALLLSSSKLDKIWHAVASHW